MFKALLDANVASVLRRIAQGDCPTEPALSVEVLEHMIQDLVDAQPATSQEGEVKRRHWEEIIGDMTDAGDLPADDAASICDASLATQPAKNKTDDVVRRNGERAVISGDGLGVVRNDAGQHRNVATQPAMSQEGEGKYDHEGRCPGCGEHVADVRNCCGD